jgi:tRNA-splicing ligase RtcB
VLCDDGCSRAIEQAHEPMCVDSDGALRPVAPFLGVADRGRRDVVRVTLANLRSVIVTPDHQIRTSRGWLRADTLTRGDRVLCPVFVGWPNNGRAHEAALLRVAGYVNGDGHIAASGSRVCLYASKDRDAMDLARDLTSLGYVPSIHHRDRPGGSIENAIYVSERSLRDRLAALGCPVGRKAGAWRGAAEPMLGLSGWARACYLSAFASAEMSTPRLIENRLQALAIKQRGPDAIEHVTVMMESLGFDVSVSRSDGENWVAQILGGDEAQLRFIAMVGFNRAAEKRTAAASAAAVAWERKGHLTIRARAQAQMRERMAAGQRVRLAAARVAAETGLTEATVVHLACRRGVLRRGRGWCPTEYSLGECAYSPVIAVEPCGGSQTYDVATADAAEAFVAGGVVVHNCGNKAVRTDLTGRDLADLGGVGRIMREITTRISFGMGVPARERMDHPVLEKIRHAPFEPQRRLGSLAASQLGTVGSGNHYVNLMEDEEGRVWVGVHFGSRGFGHKTASGFLALAQGLAFDAHAREGGMDSPPVLLEVGTELGDSYIAAMQLAGEYAYAGRDAVVAKVLEILSAEAVHAVHNHHNFAFSEEHRGRTYWVIRKGCTPARPGQEGFVGGSMGDESVILEGVESDEAEESLYSTVHGAGRVMSRTEAAGRVRKGKVVKPGKIDWPAVQARLRERGIVLVGGGADEAPEVYKRLPHVLAAHAGSIRVKHTLRPLGVAMAGRDVRDPYRD